MNVKRMMLDVLKPHQPNGLEFASAIADKAPGTSVKLTVAAVDERTESVVIVLEGESLDFDAIKGVIANLGGSIHSIDEVEVASSAARASRR
ncbi:MAG: DUF211 domain-containing protein [Burkholderiales bacterium]